MPVPPDPSSLPDTVREPVDLLVSWAQASPLGIRGVVGTLGILLLVAGARLYRIALITPGIALGLLAASSIMVGMEPATRIIVACALALTGALICYFLEKVAMRVIGLLLGSALVSASWPIVADLAQGMSTTATAPWWALVGGAIVGFVLIPYAFKHVLRAVTALMGAVLTVYALGLSDNLPLLVVLAIAGFLVQIIDGRSKKNNEAEET